MHFSNNIMIYLHKVLKIYVQDIKVLQKYIFHFNLEHQKYLQKKH